MSETIKLTTKEINEEIDLAQELCISWVQKIDLALQKEYPPDIFNEVGFDQTEYVAAAIDCGTEIVVRDSEKTYDKLLICLLNSLDEKLSYRKLVTRFEVHEDTSMYKQRKIGIYCFGKMLKLENKEEKENE